MADEKPRVQPKPRRPTRPTPKPKASRPPKDRVNVTEQDVELVVRPGRKAKGDGPEGEYWEVQVAGKRAGEVFVNVIDEPPLGRHASLQIFLNKPDQGRGVGRIAYRKAAEASQHRTIHLHMRKANVASRIAAEAAGFADVSPPGFTQLILKRDRTGA
jgi:RimJ/RimL family protein N-acetyltransferase